MSEQLAPLVFIHHEEKERGWPASFLCPWDSPGKNTRMGYPFPFSEDLANSGIKPLSPALQVDSPLPELPGKPINVFTIV